MRSFAHIYIQDRCKGAVKASTQDALALTHEWPNSRAMLHVTHINLVQWRRTSGGPDSLSPRRTLLGFTSPRHYLASASLAHLSPAPPLHSAPILSSPRLSSPSPRLLFASALCVLRLLLASAPQLLGASRKKNPARRCESRCESGSANLGPRGWAQAEPACGTASTDDGDAAATLAVPIIVPIETIEKLLPRGAPHDEHAQCIYRYIEKIARLPPSENDGGFQGRSPPLTGRHERHLPNIPLLQKPSRPLNVVEAPCSSRSAQSEHGGL